MKKKSGDEDVVSWKGQGFLSETSHRDAFQNLEVSYFLNVQGW